MIIGMEVVVVVADGASSNRKFFNLHKDVAVMQGGANYKVKNIYDRDKYVINVLSICTGSYLLHQLTADGFGLCLIYVI